MTAAQINNMVVLIAAHKQSNCVSVQTDFDDLCVKCILMSCTGTEEEVMRENQNSFNVRNWITEVLKYKNVSFM